MDNRAQNETQDNDKDKKKKSKLGVLKYGLRKKSDSGKSENKSDLSEENLTKLSKEDLQSLDVKTDGKIKKGRKEKKLQTKPSKPYSFIKKLKLGKNTSIATRRGESKTIENNKLNINMSSPNERKQSATKSTSEQDAIDDDKNSRMSDSNISIVVGVTDREIPDKSTNTFVAITQQDTSESNLSKSDNKTEDEESYESCPENTQLDREKRSMEYKSIENLEVKSDSGGEEIGVNIKVQLLSVSNTADKNSEVAESSTSFSSHLPDTENNSDYTDDKSKVEGKVTDTEDMPAYSDLIIDGSQESSQMSNVTQFGQERKEHLYKLLVIGELGTGKTSIIKRYVHQFFSQHYRATIGVDFALKVLNWDANTIIRLQLWDIAGQERFGNMTRVYYKDAVGAFIVFDATRVATFDAVVKWKQDLDSKVQLPDGSPIPCVLLGNKCDQQKEGMINIPSKMEEYCKEKGFAGWFETSAKENINIEEAARFLVNKILLNDKLLCNKDANKDNERIAIDGKGNNKYKPENVKTCSC